MLKYSVALVCLLAACSQAARAPVLEPAPQPEATFQFTHPHVWTVLPGVAIRTDSLQSFAVPRMFTRLEVLEADTAGALVRCYSCASVVEGRISWDGVIFDTVEPATASMGSIAEFALAVRQAAANRDLEALQRVMARDFTYALVGPAGREAALDAWIQEGFIALDEVPRLLDRGIATRNGTLWAAPAEHFEQIGYRGYRLGFRSTPDGRWEWIFLTRGERM